MTMPSSSASPLAQIDHLKLRPGERVRQYLLRELDRTNLRDGARLPSNRELARRLGVSVPTVQSVLKRLGREGRLEIRHGSGTYLVSHPGRTGKPLRVVIAAMLHPDEKLNDPWLRAIIEGFMPVALKSRPTTFVGLAPEKFGKDESVSALLAELSAADGLIILPYALMPEDQDLVRAAYERAGKPVVHLNPPDVNATENFVATDYLGSARALGRVWARTGRRRVALFAVAHSYAFSISTQLRLMGLAAGIGEALGESVTLQVLKPGATGEAAAYQFMKKFLAGGGPPPDAILAATRHAVPGIQRAAEEHGLKIPRDISLVSTLKSDAPPPSHETLIHEPTLPLSRNLMEMLFARIEAGAAPLPGRYLSAKIIGGGTTRPIENKRLLDEKA